jgi:hypothetical protein
MRFSEDQDALLKKHKKALSAATDESVVRQVLKAAQQELAHPAYHELGKLARQKIVGAGPRACPTDSNHGGLGNHGGLPLQVPSPTKKRAKT